MIRFLAQAEEVERLLDGYLTGTGISAPNEDVIFLISIGYLSLSYLTGT
jgi:hypothetical protein